MNTIQILLFTLTLSLYSVTIKAQSNLSISSLDSLNNTNSLTDAMRVIKILKGNNLIDTSTSKYWSMMSKASYTLYKYEDAKVQINKAISYSPLSGKYYFEKGLLHIRIGDFENALEPLNKAILIEKTAEYYFWRGICNQQLRDNNQALEDYKTAIDGKFEDPGLYLNYSAMLTKIGKFSEALKFINEAITLNPNYAEAYSIKSRILCYSFELDSAYKAMQISIDLGNYDSFRIPQSLLKESYKNRLEFCAKNLFEEEIYNEATKIYTKLIEIDSSNLNLFLNRGYCYCEMEQLDLAEKDYLNCLSSAEYQNKTLYQRLDRLYFKMGSYDKSIIYASKAINLEPNNFIEHLNRGLSYRKIGKYKEAEEDYTKGIQLSNNSFEAYGFRAGLYYEMKEYKKAYDDATKAIYLNPKYAYGYIILGQAKQKLGIADFCLDLFNAKKFKEPEADAAINKYCK